MSREEPERNLCTPTAGQFGSHPDWVAANQQLEAKGSLEACLQMAWFRDGTFEGASTTPVKVEASGILAGVDQNVLDPFTGLLFPTRDKASYQYRFRVFFFAPGLDVTSRRKLCESGEMKLPTYDCTSASARAACWFYHELRFPAPVFRGLHYPIDGDPALSCKATFRTPQEGATLEPSHERSGDGGPAETPATDAPDGIPETLPITSSNTCTSIDLGQSWVDGLSLIDNADAINDLTPTTKGDIFAVGSFASNILTAKPSIKRKGKVDAFLLRVDQKGASRAETFSGDKDKAEIVPLRIISDTSDTLYITGYFRHSMSLGSLSLRASDSLAQAFVAKRNADGTWAWLIQTRGNRGSWGSGLALSKDQKKLYLTGVTSTPANFLGQQFNANDGDHNYLLRLEPGSGKLRWIVSARQTTLTNLPLDRGRMPQVVVDENGPVWSGSFTGTMSLYGRNVQATGGWSTFHVGFFHTNAMRWFHVVASSVDMFSHAMAYNPKTKVIAVVGKIAAGKNLLVRFTQTIELRPPNAGAAYIALMTPITIEGKTYYEWSSAASLSGFVDSVKGTGVAPGRGDTWHVTGDFRGRLVLGSRALTHDSQRAGSVFVATYQRDQKNWECFLKGSSEGRLYPLGGLVGYTRAVSTLDGNLYVSGPGVMGLFGPFTRPSLNSTFVSKLHFR